MKYRLISFLLLGALIADGQTNTSPWPSSGSVGIGTPVPTEKLDVVGSIQTQGSSAGSNRIVLKDTSLSPRTWEWYPQVGGPNTLGLYERSANITPLTIVSPSGYVGIGTTSPQQLLHMSGSNPVSLLRSTGSGLRGLWTKVDDSIGAIVFDSSYNAIGSYPFSFRFGGVEAILISPNGNFGIGLSPNEKLDVAGSIQTQGSGVGSNRIVLKDTSGSPRTWEWYPQGSGPNTLALYERVSGIAAMTIVCPSGNVGIGTATPTQKLSVNGTVRAKEVIVETTGWSDYVFSDDYKLESLSTVEVQIKEQKRLPGMPLSKEVEENGVGLGEMQAKLLAKVEELTLHLIAQEKRLNSESARIAQLEQENAILQCLINNK